MRFCIVPLEDEPLSEAVDHARVSIDRNGQQHPSLAKHATRFLKRTNALFPRYQVVERSREYDEIGGPVRKCQAPCVPDGHRCQRPNMHRLLCRGNVDMPWHQVDQVHPVPATRKPEGIGPRATAHVDDLGGAAGR